MKYFIAYNTKLLTLNFPQQLDFSSLRNIYCLCINNSLGSVSFNSTFSTSELIYANAAFANDTNLFFVDFGSMNIDLEEDSADPYIFYGKSNLQNIKLGEGFRVNLNEAGIDSGTMFVKCNNGDSYKASQIPAYGTTGHVYGEFMKADEHIQISSSNNDYGTVD